jgi:hypothetical protein
VSFGDGWLFSYFRHCLALRLSVRCQFHQQNNALEFFAQGVSILLELEQWRIVNSNWGTEFQGPVIAPFCDNFAAQAWHDHSNFDSTTQASHNFIARFVASAVINHHAQLNSFHLEGKLNVVSDFLSRKDLQTAANCFSDTELTDYVLTNFPNQVPSNFRVCSLSNEISSFISSTMELLIASAMADKKLVKKQSTKLGDDGVDTVSSLDKKILSWIRAKSTKNKRSSSPWPNASEKVPSLPETVKSHYLRRLSARPLATWHRSLGVTTGQATSTASTTMPAISRPSKN